MMRRRTYRGGARLVSHPGFGGCFWVFVCATHVLAIPMRLPMRETFEYSARVRWENKEVLKSRSLDDAENPGTWMGMESAFQKGGSSGAFGTMTLSARSALLQPDEPVRLVWEAEINASDQPWIAIVAPDGDLDRLQEASEPAMPKGIASMPATP